MKTVNRGWLRRQVEAGRVEAKCCHSLTDDYAWDNANNFGVTGWMPARMSRPTYKEITYASGNTTHVVDDHDFIEGRMNLIDFDFHTKSGAAWQEPDGTICLVVHSNLSYELRIVAPRPA